MIKNYHLLLRYCKKRDNIRITGINLWKLHEKCNQANKKALSKSIRAPLS